MGQTPIYHLPWPAATDPADVPTDMQELAVAVEAAFALAVDPVVTVLPATPSDGQSVLYRAGANGPLWRLRYSAAMFALDGYGWEFVGGATLGHEVDATDTINSATYVNAATVGPRVVVPLAGLYVCEFGFSGQPTNAVAAVLNGSVVWNDGAAQDADAAGIQTPSAGGMFLSVSRTRRMTAPAAGADVRMKYRQVTAAAGASVLRRWLVVTPNRVK